MHVICTCREKPKLLIKDGEVRELGYKPIQQKEMGFEFDIVGQVDYLHKLTFKNTRCWDLSNKSFTGENLAERKGPGLQAAPIIAKWLCEGEAAPEETNAVGVLDDGLVRQIEFLRTQLDIPDREFQKVLRQRGATQPAELGEDDAHKLIAGLTAQLRKRDKEAAARRPEPEPEPEFEPAETPAEAPQEAEGDQYLDEPCDNAQKSEIFQLLREVEPDAKERDAMLKDALHTRGVHSVHQLTRGAATDMIRRLQDLLNPVGESLVDGIMSTLDGQPETLNMESEANAPDPAPTQETMTQPEDRNGKPESGGAKSRKPRAKTKK